MEQHVDKLVKTSVNFDKYLEKLKKVIREDMETNSDAASANKKSMKHLRSLSPEKLQHVQELGASYYSKNNSKERKESSLGEDELIVEKTLTDSRESGER